MSKWQQWQSCTKYDVFLKSTGEHLGTILAYDLDDAVVEASMEWGEELEFEITPAEGGYE